jgi:hypothetical protein
MFRVVVIIIQNTLDFLLEFLRGLLRPHDVAVGLIWVEHEPMGEFVTDDTTQRPIIHVLGPLKIIDDTLQKRRRQN